LRERLELRLRVGRGGVDADSIEQGVRERLDQLVLRASC
jgi:hypothetical protein